jgi:hypothetical protein
MSVGISNGVLNQKNAPAIYEDIFANRPSAGFSGRIFISTDTSQIFVDNGTSWVLIANTGIGSTGNLQVVTTNGNTTSAGIVITAGGLTTNAITQASLTSGSVLFATSGGTISQDNTNLFWDNTNKWLGIGTSPSSPLDIHSSAAASMLALNNTGGNASNIIFLNASVNKWRIGNTASNTFDLFNNQIGTTALSFNGSNSAATFINSITATSLIKSGGTSSQFLKADGSVDSSSYITLANLSATTPLSYNSGTGAFTILQSGASQSGYLSSTDWNTFNNKASLSAFSASPPLSYNSGTGAFSITQSSGSTNGYLSSTDWTTFNNKQSALTNPITGTGTSGYVPKFNGTTALTNSIIQDDGTYVSVGYTTNPSLYKLDVNGTGRFTGALSGTSATFSDVVTDKATNISADGAGVVLQGYVDNNLRIAVRGSDYNNGARGGLFASTGDFNSTLSVTGAATFSSNVILPYSGALAFNSITNQYIASDSTHLYLGTANLARLTIDTNGNVGIKTTTPALTLDVNGEIRATGYDGPSTGSGLELFYLGGNSYVSSQNRDTSSYIPLYLRSSLTCFTNGSVLFNGATSSNGQGALQNTGQSFTGGLGIGGLTFSTNTTASVNTSFYFFNGGAGVTLTMPDTNGQSMVYYIKNYSASPLTIGRTGSNTFIAVGTIVTTTSLTLASGASATLLGNGTTNYIQLL